MPTDPAIEHSAHLSSFIEKLVEKGGVSIPQVDPAPAPTVVEPPAKEPEAPAVEPTRTVVEDSKPVVVAQPVVAGAKPPVDKMARRLEIQRNADAAVRRARAEAGRLRSPTSQVAASKVEAPAVDSKELRALTEEKQRVAKVQANLDAEIRLMKADPLGFARRHGVTGAAISEYVARGLDPNTIAIQQLREEASRAIQQVREESRREVTELRQTLSATQEAQIQRNFFEFAEEAKVANPDTFAALNSGLVMSDKEVWDTANRLLEERADLRDDFDEDRLLEAVETEARKDPRWAKVQKLLPTSATTSKTQAAATTKSNARAKEEATTETTTTVEAKPPRQTPPRDPSGQFVSPKLTPVQEHALHVEQVLSRTRLGF